MLTTNKLVYFSETDEEPKRLLEGHCLSSDTKPTEGVHNGSLLLEMDTSTVYFFDEAGKRWLPWS